jgi:ribosomal protein L21
MYAVVEDGSKQYILKQGDVVRLDFRQVETGEQAVLRIAWTIRPRNGSAQSCLFDLGKNVTHFFAR